MTRLAALIVAALTIGAVPGAAQRAPMTARIEGQVVTAASNSPVRAAQVRAHHDDGTDRLVTTDEEGRFARTSLQSGRWTLTISKAGYLTQRFGQRRPFGPAAPIDIAAGKTIKANFILTRAGAITGRVYGANVVSLGESIGATRRAADTKYSSPMIGGNGRARRGMYGPRRSGQTAASEFADCRPMNATWRSRWMTSRTTKRRIRTFSRRCETARRW